MELNVEGIAKVIEQLRIFYINLGIPGPLFGVMVIVGLFVWKLPDTIRAVNERTRINAEAARRAKVLLDKIDREMERRSRREKK